MIRVKALALLLVVSVLAVLTAGLAHAGNTPQNPQDWPTSISGNGWTCTYTNPEYMIHAGEANVDVRAGSTWFHAKHTGPDGVWEDPYLTAGFNHSLSSAYYCDSRPLPDGRGKHGKSFKMPVKIGKQGHILATVKAWTSPHFRGDDGFDIWLEPHPWDVNYAQMDNGGDASVEIMIWLNHPGLQVQSSNLRYYPYRIAGRWWRVGVGLASYGHGQNSRHPNGWTVVNFIAPQVANGTVKVHRLVLNSFISYAIARGWLPASDYWMSINQGAEFTSGSMTAQYYSLTGLK